MQHFSSNFTIYLIIILLLYLPLLIKAERQTHWR